MSYRIGKNHQRNLENRKQNPKVKYPTNRVLVPQGEQADKSKMQKKHEWFERNRAR